MESMTQRNYSGQNSLLGKGIALSQLPTIHEALEGNLPLRLVIWHSHFPYDTYKSMALKPILRVSFIQLFQCKRKRATVSSRFCQRFRRDDWWPFGSMAATRIGCRSGQIATPLSWCFFCHVCDNIRWSIDSRFLFLWCRRHHHNHPHEWDMQFERIIHSQFASKRQLQGRRLS